MKSRLIQRVLLASVSMCTPITMFACGDSDSSPTIETATVGALSISVSPSSAEVRVTGPDDFDERVDGSEILVDLQPGEYRVVARATGYVTEEDTVTVSSSHTTAVSFALQRGPDGVIARTAYKDSDGNWVKVDVTQSNLDRFKFYAWLEDEAGGIDLGADAPGEPSAGEQTELAPSRTQNVAAAWVGYVGDDDKVHPVAGADVRWQIDRQYPEALNSVIFGTADNSVSIGSSESVSIDNDQANTRTNNASAQVPGYPTDELYPLFNKTGVPSPVRDGFTWVTLFSPDMRARARVIAVASIDGVEIGKEVLTKRFAPLAQLTITKEASQADINLGAEGEDTVNFVVTITNQGEGDASRVVLRDALSTGLMDNYEVIEDTLPEGAELNDNAVDYEFSLDAGESTSFSFDARLTATGAYCNVARVVELTDEYRTVEPDVFDQVCVAAFAPELSVLKDFVSDDGEGLGSRVEVEQGDMAHMRIRVTNRGTAVAEDVGLSDILARVDGDELDGDNEDYQLDDLPGGAEDNDNDGFDLQLGDIDPEETVTITFNATAQADGEYCDQASLSSGEQNEACLVVASPKLEIEKVLSYDTAVPTQTYDSRITVTNVGNATARDVVLLDRLGLNEDAGRFVAYESSAFDDLSGSFADGVVSISEPINIRAGQTVALVVTSRIPAQAPAGPYCDLAWFESSNADTDEVEACVEVPAFAALQTQLVDADDALRPRSSTQLTSTLYNEFSSNESVVENKVKFTAGIPLDGDDSAVFEIDSTVVYLDTTPSRNQDTGLIVSTPSNSGAIELVAGDDYEITDDGEGEQTIVFDGGLELPPNAAVYIQQSVSVPKDVDAGDYSIHFEWTARGSTADDDYRATASELTTVTK